ncbi:MAG: L-glutamate gamma-semialdehyde dehydrogenase [Candidatus Neomarinimicrobiota bacterium]
MDKNFKAVNAPIIDFEPGSKHREELIKEIERQSNREKEIPVIIHGKEYYTGNTKTCTKPHNHQHILGTYHEAGEKEIEMAIESNLEAWKSWSNTSLDYRASIFKKVADLIDGPYRYKINAAAMLDLGKSVFQAEVDASCELIDFLNFNIEFAYKMQETFTPISPEGMHNALEFRPLEGFVFAIAPFNFFSIGGNLAIAPAVVGNTVLWKPASSVIYSSYVIMELYKEAGLPDGVVNFLPGSGSQIGNKVLNHKDLAGVHFTGSTETFRSIWKTVSDNIENYKNYPKLVGETGGKDFCIAHESANIDALVTGMVRGAFEYQGQKCSAMSRAYLPKNQWNEIKEKLIKEVATIDVGPTEDLKNFVNAVIDENAFDKIASYIDFANDADDCDVLCGGTYDKSKGYFIQPTVVVTSNPHFKTLEEEIFGPVLTIYVYDNNKWSETLDLIDNTSPYALTGCVFSEDKAIAEEVKSTLRFAAGNFYINDKPTGAVVGQQPFGGSRASGTNDKGGSMLNLLRWTSPRTIKETFEPPKDYRYPYMD